MPLSARSSWKEEETDDDDGRHDDGEGGDDGEDSDDDNQVQGHQGAADEHPGPGARQDTAVQEPQGRRHEGRW